MSVEVLKLNLKDRTALLSDHRLIPISVLLDGYGDETNDIRAACAFIAKGGETQWFWGAVRATDGLLH